ncbi:MAG: PAS domain-containing protein [Candidatus Sedimenticola sp. (ex Thyasira tokunagai)]
MSDGIIQDETEAPSSSGFSRQSRKVMSAALILTAIVLVFLFVYAISHERARLEEGVRSQLASLVGGRLRVIDSGLENQRRREQGFVETPSLRMIAAELTSGSVTEGGRYAAAIGRFQELLNNFAVSGGLSGVLLVDAKGEVFLSSADSPALPQAAQEIVEALYRSGEEGGILFPLVSGKVGYFRATAIRSIQPAVGKNDFDVVAALVTVRVFDEWLSDHLDPGEGVSYGQAFYLLTENSVYGKGGELQQSERAAKMSFSREESLTGSDREVYTLSRNLAATGWTLSIEVSASMVDSPLFGYKLTGIVVGCLLLLLVGSGMEMLLNRQDRALQAAMAEHYKVAAERVEAQRRFLDGINAALPDLIGVKNREGRYIYVNPAMVKVLHKAKQEILGQVDRQLFSEKVTRRLSELGDSAYQQGGAVRDSEVIGMEDGERYYLFGAVPLNHSGDVGGSLIVTAKDVTELHRLQLEKEHSADNTIAALLATIEKKDPYLKGQTAFTSQLATGMGEILGLSSAQRQSLHQAALLSQIGKSFIPQELSTRSERLDSDELSEVRQHIGQAVDTLEPLGLAAGTMNALKDMYERLDGSGFPRGVSGEGVDRLGRVLGIADIITARALPRSNRNPIEAEEAVKVLQEHPSRYEPEIVNAARNYLNSVVGAEFIDQIRRENSA